MPPEETVSPHRTSTPIPDPTVLTTQQLIRELNALREVLETRLDGMDTAIMLVQASTDKMPARIDEKIASLAQIHEEKFRSIQTQFTERDVRTEQTARDSKVAVDAALQAAKEAVGEQNRSSSLSIQKAETGTAEQIRQQALLITTATRALDDKIDDIKERLTRIEGRGEGSVTTKATSQQMIMLAIAALGVFLAVMSSGIFNRREAAVVPVVAPPVPVVIVQPPVGGGSGMVETTDTSKTTTTKKP